jgi:molecular chaperone GrpE
MRDHGSIEEEAVAAHPPEEPEPSPDPDSQVAALEEERAVLTDRLLRLAAEFENWKKRAARELDEAGRRERETVLLGMLDVVDGLERALAALGENADPRAVREGVALVLRTLLQKLEGYGIKPVSAIGEPFDPRLHDAVAKAPSREVEPGTVLSELQKGYLMSDRLLRPASVVVAEAADPPARTPRS